MSPDIEGPPANKPTSRPALVWRVIHVIMATFFLLAACTNANDDDWWLWTPIYGVPALLCLLAAARPSIVDWKPWRLAAVALLCFCVVYGVYQVQTLMTVVSQETENPLQHEEGRELGGLLIIITWAGLAAFCASGDSAVMNNNKMFAMLLWLSGTLAVMPLVTWSLCFVGDWHTRLAHCNAMFTG